MSQLRVAPLLIALPLASLFVTVGVLGTHWLLLTGLVVTLMVVVGTAVRLIGSGSLRSRATAWWLQLLTLVTVLLLRQAAIGWDAGDGGGAVWGLLRSFGVTLADGVWHTLWYESVPYPQRDSVDTVIVLMAGLIVLLNDLVMRVSRLPALSLLWLFLPLALPLQLPIETSPLVVVPVAVLFLVALLICSKPRQRAKRSAAGLGVIAAVTALVVALPLVLPDPRAVASRIPADIRDIGPAWFPPPVPALSESIDLASHLRRSEPVDILRYRVQAPMDLRLRLTTLGDTTQGGFTEVAVDESVPLLPVTSIREVLTPWGAEMAFTVESMGFSTPSLPVPQQVLRVDIEPGRVDGFDPVNESVVIADGRQQLEPELRWGGTADAGINFSGLSWILREGGGVMSAPVEGPPLWAGEPERLPEELEPLRPLAQEIVGDAESDVEMVRRLESWFWLGDWQYSEEVPFAGYGSDVEGQWDALLEFMDARVGYCVHYASAFAALALALGIPSRVVVGFLPGRAAAEGWRVVDTNDFHAWTEVYINGFGWVEVDVTPPIMAGQRQASETDDSAFGPGGTAPTPRETDDPEASATPEPSESEAEPTDDALDPNQQSNAPEASADASESDEAAAGDGLQLPDLRWLLLVLGAVLVIMLPSLIRSVQRMLRRRQGAIGAWRELLATAADAGVRLASGLTAAQIADEVAAMLPEKADVIRSLRMDAESASFGRPDSPQPPYDRTAVDRVSAALWQRHSVLARLVRQWLPPSLVPQSIRSLRIR